MDCVFRTPDTQYTPARARPLHLFWSPDVFLHVALQLHIFVMQISMLGHIYVGTLVTPY